MSRTIVIGEALEALCTWAAVDTVAQAVEAIAARGRFTWVLSGGSTPRPLFEKIAREAQFRDAVDWGRVHVFWSDERHVAPDHPDSNYGMARGAMLGALRLPEANIHRMRGEMADVEAAARAYEDELSRFFALPPDQMPAFDLALLGMGADGHTASLFPGSPALAEARRRVVATWSESAKAHRITLTFPALNAATRVVVLVAGADKAVTVQRVLEGPPVPDELPSQRISSTGSVVWALDREAAARLRQ